MNKKLPISILLLFLFFTTGCQDKDVITTQNNKEILYNKELILQQKNIELEKAANEKFQRELAAAVDAQIQQQREQKEKEDLEIVEAKQKIATLEKESHLRKLQSDKQDAERQLKEKQVYYADLQRQQRENAIQLKKHQDEMAALQKQRVETDKTAADLIKKMRENNK